MISKLGNIHNGQFQLDTVLSAAWLAIVLVFALFGPWLTGDSESPGLLPFSPDKLHPSASLQPPMSQLADSGKVFYLGSDHLGRDLLSGIIAGTRNSMLVSVAAMLLATFIGTLAGGAAGFFGDREFILSRASYLALAFHLLLTWFYLIYIPRYAWKDFGDLAFMKASGFVGELLLFWAGILIITYAFYVLLRYIPYMRRSLYFPLDSWSTGFTEVFASIPRLFLVLSLVAVIQPGVYAFIFLMGVTSWVGAARLIRGQMLAIRRQEYVEAAYALGLKRMAVWFKHAIPNSASVILVDFTFGVAAILMAESTLSFLGVGLPPGVISWGKLLSNIKYDATAWWLVIFPGLAIFFTILSIHTIGDASRKKINPKSGT